MGRLLTLLRALCGIATALLLARLVLYVLAARPNNPAFAALFALTAPLITPLAGLDAGQPHDGARLEFSTLAAALAFGVCIIVVRTFANRQSIVKRRRRD